MYFSCISYGLVWSTMSGSVSIVRLTFLTRIVVRSSHSQRAAWEPVVTIMLGLYVVS